MSPFSSRLLPLPRAALRAFGRALLALVAVPSTWALVASGGCDALDEKTDIAGLIASQFVTVTVDAADLQSGVLASDGAVSPESFLANLREQMGTIDSVNLTRIVLTPASNGVVGVAAWSDLYQGDLVVQLVPASGAPLAVGKIATPASGLEALTPQVTTSRDALDAAPDIAAGRFSVRLTAGSPRAAGDVFELPVRVELEFIAF